MTVKHIGALIHRKEKDEMSVFRNIQSRVQSLKKKTQGYHKWKMFLYAGIIILIAGVIWLTQTNQGWIARNSFFKTFDTNRERIVTVYGANGEPVRRFEGTYNVEFFDDKYLVIMNQHTDERVNVYGNSTIVIDESPQFDHSVEGDNLLAE